MINNENASSLSALTHTALEGLDNVTDLEIDILTIEAMKKYGVADVSGIISAVGADEIITELKENGNIVPCTSDVMCKRKSKNSECRWMESYRCGIIVDTSK